MGAIPSGDDRGEKERVLEPGVFEAKNRGLRDGSGGGDNEWEVVRCEAGKGGEGGFGEKEVPILVEESAVETGEGGGELLVRPGERAIKEGQLE